MRTLVAFLLLALSACTHPPDVSTEFAPVISDMAHKLLASGRSGEIPRAEWPPAIADELHPEAIRLHEEGVYIMTSRFFVEEAGVFVPRRPQQFTPGAGGDPEYRHVALDVYTYMIKG